MCTALQTVQTSAELHTLQGGAGKPIDWIETLAGQWYQDRQLTACLDDTDRATKFNFNFDLIMAWLKIPALKLSSLDCSTVQTGGKDLLREQP